MESLDPVIVERTHDAVVLQLGVQAPLTRTFVFLQGLVLFAVVGPLSLVGVAFPGAWLVEQTGLWLVNEVALAGRWLGFGGFVWLAIVALAWKAWLEPPEQRIEVGTRAITVTRRRFGREVSRVRVPRDRIRGAVVAQGSLRPVIQVILAEGSLVIPITEAGFPAAALARLIEELAPPEGHEEREEGPASIPAALRRLLGAAQQP